MDSSLLLNETRREGPATSLDWLAPPWAATCGALAGFAMAWSVPSLARWLISMALAEIMVALVWDAALDVHWAALARAWAMLKAPTTSLPGIPYVQPDAPGHRLSMGWRRFRAWFSRVLWPTGGRAIATLLLLGPALLPVAGLLSTTAFWITLACLAYIALAAVLASRTSRHLPVAPLAVTGAWLIGQAAVGGMSWQGAAGAVLAGVVFAGFEPRLQPWFKTLTMVEVAEVALVLLLVFLRSTVPAILVGLLVVTQQATRAAVRNDIAAARLVRQTAFLVLLIAALAIGNR